jgi:hypothetical protein
VKKNRGKYGKEKKLVENTKKMENQKKKQTKTQRGLFCGFFLIYMWNFFLIIEEKANLGFWLIHYKL